MKDGKTLIRLQKKNAKEKQQKSFLKRQSYKFIGRVGEAWLITF